MARNTMQRSFTVTTVDFSDIVTANGKVDVIPQTPIKLDGKLTEEKARKEIVKMDAFKGKQIVVTNVSYDTETYTMEISKFLEMATKTTQPEEDKTEEK